MTRSIQESVRLGDLFRDEFHWYCEQAQLCQGNLERPTLASLFKILRSRLKRLEAKRLSACDPAQIKDLAQLLSYLPAPPDMTAFGSAFARGLRADREEMSSLEGTLEDLCGKTWNHLKTLPPFDEILAITNPKVKKARHAPVAVRQLAVLAYDIHLRFPYPTLTWRQIAAILKKDHTTIRNAVRRLKKFLCSLEKRNCTQRHKSANAGNSGKGKG
jgi:hypothetical protein